MLHWKLPDDSFSSGDWLDEIDHIQPADGRTSRLDLALEALFMTHGAGAAGAIASFSRNLYDHLGEDARDPQRLLGQMGDFDYHIIQLPIFAVQLNEVLRRLGPDSEPFKRTVDIFENSDVVGQRLYAVALQGLFDGRLLEICRSRLMTIVDPCASQEALVSFNTTLLLVRSFRDRKGFLEPEAKALMEECAGQFDAESPVKGIIENQAQAYRAINSPEEDYLDACREHIEADPDLQNVIISRAPEDELPAICMTNAVRILSRYQEGAVEGAAKLIQSLQTGLGDTEVKSITRIIADSSEPWEKRLAFACLLTGRGVRNSKLLELLIGDDIEGALLAVISLWDEKMSAEARHELEIILRNQLVTAKTARFAAYLVGSTGDADLGNLLFSDSSGVSSLKREAVRESYLCGFWTTAPERVYARWKETGELDFEPYRYNGWLEE